MNMSSPAPEISQPAATHRFSEAHISARISLCLGLYVIAGGLTSLAGWVFDLPRLTDWDFDGISIQPNAALTATAAGAALVLLSVRHLSAARLLGLLVAVIAGATLFEHILDADFGIDGWLLFDRSWGSAGTVVPGRMGVPASVSLTLCGAAIVLSTGGDQFRRAVPPLGILITLIAAISITGLLFGADRLFAIPRLTTIASQTASFIFAMGMGMIVLHPDLEPMRTFVDRGSAGVLLRRITPWLIVMPLAIGWVRVTGERAGLYDSAFGTAVRTFVEIVLFGIIVWRAVRAVAVREASLQAATEAATFARQALRFSESRAAQTLASIRDGCYLLDRESRFTYFNDAARRTFTEQGHDVASLIGQRLPDVFPAASQLPGVRAISRTLEEKCPTEAEQFHEPWGRWFHVRNYPTADGGVSTFFLDITDRKRAEAALRTSQDNLQLELDAAQQLQEVSTQLIGTEDVEVLYDQILQTATSLMGSDFASLQLLDPDRTDGPVLRLLGHRGFSAAAVRFWDNVQPSSMSTCGMALASDQRIVIPDVRECDDMRDSDDQRVYLEAGIIAVQSTPLYARNGRIVGMLSTHWRMPHQPVERELRLLDILARMAADLIERRHTEEALRDADRKKNEFLAVLAHELRNPLAPVKNSLQIMRQATVDGAVIAECHGIIEQQVTQMARLIDDLLDVSRISRNQLQLKTARIDLAKVIDQVLRTCRPVAAAAGHNIEVVLPDRPVYVLADEVRLAQVFGNLVNNACKYTEPGGHIQVTVDREGSDAVVTIADDGVGISSEMLPKVFEMFTQVDRTLERSQGGLGIGLSLVKRLVELHGGTVIAHSNGLGRGSRFVVRLPVLLEAPPEMPRKPHCDMSVVGERILIVDDNRDAATTLSMLLSLKGGQTATAHDGHEALQKAAEFRPDVIFLDIGLPKMNGYDVCRSIRVEPWGREILMIALTGWGQDEDRRKSEAAGFDEHLVKPIDQAELANLLATRRMRASTGNTSI